MTTVDLPLLPLGRGVDLGSERGVECPGDLPSPSDPDLVARARAAKEALGSRVFVLGHHYQRDEVIQFADVTGDSFKLASEAAARPDAEFIVFCGVHFMAESADILTSPDAEGDPPRPRGRLLDGRHGPAAAGRGRLGRHGGRPGIASDVRAGDLHELQRRHQGVLRPPRRRGLHLLQRRDRARVGLPAGHEGAVPPRPAPRPQHRRAEDGALARRLRGLGPAPPERRAHRRAAARREDDPLEGPLLGARPVLRGHDRRPARHHPGRPDPRAPRVQARGRARGGPGRLDRVHHPDHRGRPRRLRLGRRHRAQPRASGSRPSTPTSGSSSSTRPSATARR